MSVAPFAEKVSVMAPVEFASDDQWDEASCQKMYEIENEEPIGELLTDYLKDVLRDVQYKLEEERFNRYGGPIECERIIDRSECEEAVFRNNSPLECVEELFDQNGISFNRNYGIGEARRDCEAILFDLEAPQ